MIRTVTIGINFQAKNGKICAIIFINKQDLIRNLRHDLSINDYDTEALCFEITDQKLNRYFY